jgi:hypothetical protein
MFNRFARALVLLIIAAPPAVPVAASAHEVTSVSLSCLSYAGSPTGQSTVTSTFSSSQTIQISGSSGKVSGQVQMYCSSTQRPPGPQGAPGNNAAPGPVAAARPHHKKPKPKRHKPKPKTCKAHTVRHLCRINPSPPPGS